jgi:hypothetical protein
MREVGEAPRKRAPRGERAVVLEDVAEVHPRVVRHAFDALATGVLPWQR